MERLEIIEALKHGPDRIAAEVAGLEDATLRYRPAEGQWSPKEIVGHLRDAAEVWYRRLYSVWSLTDPVFVPFDGDAWVIERGYQDADLARVLTELKEQRLRTVDLLSHAVDWTRLGSQRGVGRRTLKQFAELHVVHDDDHIAQIRAAKAAAQAPTTST